MQRTWVDSDAFACPQQVCVHGEEEGDIHIDGAFTGARAPIALALPSGTYDIGVGFGTGDPPIGAGEAFVHEGRFRHHTTPSASGWSSTPSTCIP